MPSFDDMLDDDDLTLEDIEEPIGDNDGGHVSGRDELASNLLMSENINYAFIESTLSSFNSHMDQGLILAMAELLEELTGGRLTTFHNKVEAERMVLVAHSNLALTEYLNDFYNDLVEGRRNTGEYNIKFPPAESFATFIIASNKFFNFMLNKYTRIYKDACETCGVEPDLKLIEHGYYSMSTRFRKYGFGNPPHVNEN